MLIGVGLSRTGTTTLGDAGEILGLSRLGWVSKRRGYLDAHGEPIGSPALIREWREGQMDHIIEVASCYGVVEDLPWPFVYRELAEALPEAQFVLTRRASPEAWLASMSKHQSGSRSGQWSETLTEVYGAPKATDRPDSYLAKYETHNAEVRDFFAGTDRLLEVCWEEGDGWPGLCGFLGLPVPDVPFPHSNVAGPRPRGRPLPWRRRIRRKYRGLMGGSTQ